MPFNPNNSAARKAFFAKKKLSDPLGNPMVSPTVVAPTNTPPSAPQPEAVRVALTPKTPKFGRIRRVFKI
jgi:hypothetical protein